MVAVVRLCVVFLVLSRFVVHRHLSFEVADLLQSRHGCVAALTVVVVSKELKWIQSLNDHQIIEFMYKKSISEPIIVLRNHSSHINVRLVVQRRLALGQRKKRKKEQSKTKER